MYKVLDKRDYCSLYVIEMSETGGMNLKERR